MPASRSPRSFSLIGFGFLAGLLYMPLDALIMAFVLNKGGFTQQLLHPDPDDIWMRGSVLVLTTLFGFFSQRIVNTHRDTTAALKQMESKRQTTEIKLLASRKLLETVFEASPDMIFIHATEGPILEVNNNVLDRYGFSKAAIRDASVEKLSGNGYTHDMAMRHIQRALTGQAEDFEWLAKDRHNHEFPVEVRLRRLKEDPAPGEPAVVAVVRDITSQKKSDNALRSLAKGALETEFDDFLRQAAHNLAAVYDARFAFVGRLIEPARTHVQTLAVWAGEGPVDNFSYALEGTPCNDIINLKAELIPTNAAELYAGDEMLLQMGVDSYYGVPLIGSSGQMLGLVSVMDTHPMHPSDWSEPVLKVFAARLANEIERHETLQALKLQEIHLEQQVAKRTQELESINRELEAFSYSVSHDLRAPLRSIDGFSQVLLEDYRELLDETGQDYLQRVRRASQRMGILIDELLQLSRIGRGELKITTCNLSELAARTVTHLREQYPQRQVKTLIAPEMKIQGDATLIGIMLDNLIGNAWKYSSNNPQAEIEFGSKVSDGQRVYHIRDNGCGFDKRYADKLFGAFQRLHGSEYEGTGIGLATAQRIIHRLGGDIWADAELNKGAIFYFILPPK